jgi:hypothetical protein
MVMHPEHIISGGYYMKKLWYVNFVAVPCIVLLLLGCATGSGGGGGTYYIRATIDGTVWEFLYGISDVEPEPFATYDTEGAYIGTEINAQTTETVLAVQPDSYITFYIDNTSTSPAVYNIDDFIDAYFKLNGTFWDFTVITFTITTYGPVGETIEGTFYGELLEYLGSATKTVTGGEFKIVRAPDNVWPD